jgi:hypothetical protein
MHWNFDTHKGIPMKIRFAFGIDRWVDHKWKESLVLISGDMGIVLLVLTSSVLYFDRISLISLSKYLLLNFL